MVFSHGSYSKYCLPKGIYYNYKIKFIDNSSIKYLLIRIITKLKINKFFKYTYFKKLYFKLITFIFFGYKDLKQKVLIFESSRLAKLEGYIEHLRIYRKNQILIFYLTNVQTKEYFSKNKKMLISFDQIFSFSKVEASRHGLIYARVPIFLEEIKSNKKCDKSGYKIYFNGRDKGRLNELKKISEIFKARSIKFKFIILDELSTINKNNFPDFRFISKPIKYEKIINQSNCSDVLLDLYSKKLKDEESYTLRLTEALILNKKIITNNTKIVDEDFYDSKKILYFQDYEELKIKITNFLKVNPHNYDKDTYKDFLPGNLIKQIDNIN